MAKGYLIANITVTDTDGYQEYRRQVLPVVERYGGRFLVRGGAVSRVENGDGFDRVVVLEFDSIEAARKFYDSPDYAPLLKLRQETTRSQVILVEGA